MAQAGQRSRLKSRYEEEIRPALIERFQYSTPMQAPVIRKITLNMGVGDAKQDSKVLEAATEQLATIAGQRPSVRRARKSIAAFKLREGMPVGVSVTLRGERSYEFLDRLMSVAIPRIRDFRGMNPRSFDGRGNYSLGVREQIIFPEIDYDAIDQTRGLDITITTSAKTDAEAFALLEAFGFPFARPEGAAAPTSAFERPAQQPEAPNGALESPASEEAAEIVEEIAAELVAEELVEEIAAELVAEEIVEEIAAEFVAEEIVEEIAQELVAEEAVEELVAEEAVEELVAEEAVEELVAEEIAQELVAEEIAQELVAEEIAQELAAEQIAQELAAEEIAQELVAEVIVEELAVAEAAGTVEQPATDEAPASQEPAAEAEAAAEEPASSGEPLAGGGEPAADQPATAAATTEPKDQE
jgi:large subunit ribosomal protein L5